MPASKKVTKKITKKVTKKAPGKKTGTPKIPVLTRRADSETVHKQQENHAPSQHVERNTLYAQEIRTLVTIAVHECVPHIIDHIMDKLILPPEGSAQNKDQGTK